MAAMAQLNRPVLAERDVDTQETRSLSFGPSTGTRGELGKREPVPVGPGRPPPSPSLSFPIGEVVHEFPLQPAKVQRPPLRRETLRRERLLDWLKVKIHHRVVLVTAEAGYGKTTLLADFARHHRRPTMWYRLDDEDRNWVSFCTTWSPLGVRSSQSSRRRRRGCSASSVWPVDRRGTPSWPRSCASCRVSGRGAGR